MEPEGSLQHSQVHTTRARSIQSMPPHPTSWRSVLILSSHICMGFPSSLFPSGFPAKAVYSPPLSPHACYMPSPSHSSRNVTQTILGKEYRSLSSTLCSILQPPITSTLLGPNIHLSTLFSNTLAYIPPSMWMTKSDTHTQQQTKF
jgi:hypothetical protein